MTPTPTNLKKVRRPKKQKGPNDTCRGFNDILREMHPLIIEVLAKGVSDSAISKLAPRTFGSSDKAYGSMIALRSMLRGVINDASKQNTRSDDSGRVQSGT